VEEINGSDVRPELTIDVIEELMAQGHSQSEIARMFGVTRHAVSWHKRTYNGRLTARQEVMLTFPWKGVSQEQARCSAYRRLRDHGEFVVTAGKDWDADKLRRLRAFYKKIREGWVLEYDPRIPPEPGFALHGGFALRKRLASDGDMLFRLNEFCQEPTEEGRLIWRLPEVDP